MVMALIMSIFKFKIPKEMTSDIMVRTIKTDLKKSCPLDQTFYSQVDNIKKPKLITVF